MMMWGLLTSDVRLTYRSTVTVIYQGEVRGVACRLFVTS